MFVGLGFRVILFYGWGLGFILSVFVGLDLGLPCLWV